MADPKGFMTTPRVTPRRIPAWGGGVKSTPRFTAQRFIVVPSVTWPAASSMIASSAPATFASSLAITCGR